METYTLQRFYHEAKALIEKHNAVDNDFCLEVQFQIEESDLIGNVQAPRLKCAIYYRDRKRSSSHNKEHWISEFSPAHALARFEEELAEKKGELMKERVAIELPEKN